MFVLFMSFPSDCNSRQPSSVGKRCLVIAWHDEWTRVRGQPGCVGEESRERTWAPGSGGAVWVWSGAGTEPSSARDHQGLLFCASDPHTHTAPAAGGAPQRSEGTPPSALPLSPSMEGAEG